MLHSIIGVKAELVGPTGYQPNAELGVFREIVEQHPAGICLSAGRPEIFQAEIDQAVTGDPGHPSHLRGFRRRGFEARAVHRNG